MFTDRRGRRSLHNGALNWNLKVVLRFAFIVLRFNKYSTNRRRGKGGKSGILRYGAENCQVPLVKNEKKPAKPEKIAKAIAFSEQVCYNTRAIN